MHRCPVDAGARETSKNVEKCVSVSEPFVVNAMGTVVSVTAAVDGAAKKAVRGVFERWWGRARAG